MEDIKLSVNTESICPVCLKKITAQKVKYDDKVYLEKYCPEHGKFKTLIWDGEPSIESWSKTKIPYHTKTPNTSVTKGCPYDCGLCPEHRQRTCTALIEVTERCNLKCEYCFASAGKDTEDLSLEDIKFMYESILKSGGICNIQISGGEPTVREDLPDIIKLGFDMGFKFIQVNTNGIRIAENIEYARKLKEAGLNSIFLQFDGTNDSIYIKVRGINLIDTKIKAIENCRKLNIGVVLVPTIVPKVNLDNIGDIIHFAIKNIPTVRGVHFQPVSYFGRFPSAPDNLERVTIPKILRCIEEQTDGIVKAETFKPSCCENSFCSFHGNFVYKGKGELMAITDGKSNCCGETLKAEVGAIKSISVTARNWSGVKVNSKIPKISDGKVMSWDDIIYNIKKYSFSISGMAFQDVWNLDMERLKDCCIHTVTKDGKLIPFCAYNLTDCNGSYIYRKNNR